MIAAATNKSKVCALIGPLNDEGDGDGEEFDRWKDENREGTQDIEAMAVEAADKAKRRLAANQRNPNGDNNA
jgi:hypothetical protein